MTYRGIIFDLDGTLLDSAPGIRGSLAYAMRKVCPSETGRLSGVVIGPPIRHMLLAVWQDAPLETLAALVAAYREHYDTVGWRETTLYPGVPETLRWLQEARLPLYVATNKPRAVTVGLLRHFALDSCFADAVSVDVDDPALADKTKIVKRLLEAHHLPHQKTMLIGDGHGDAEAAAANQVPFVWAAYGYGTNDILKQYPFAGQLSEVSQLPELLQSSQSALGAEPLPTLHSEESIAVESRRI